MLYTLSIKYSLNELVNDLVHTVMYWLTPVEYGLPFENVGVFC